MTISTAIDPGALARVVGYALGFKDFSNVSSNLPQRISVFSVIAESKQSGFTDYNKRFTITSAQDVLDLFGVCPAYYVTRILKPVQGGGVGSIPVDIYPIQETTPVKAIGSLTITGTATKTIEHKLIFNGRTFIDGNSSRYTVETGDTPADVVTKIVAAVNGMINSPVTAVDAGGGVVNFTSKWAADTANEIDIDIDVSGDSAGLVYALPTFSAGAGTIDLSAALANIGEIWTTLIVNTFDSGQFDPLQDFNGAPDPNTGGTGRWNAKTVKPFVAVLGSVASSTTTLKSIMASRKDDLTNALATAPNSLGYSFEVAANAVGVTGRTLNDKPHSTPGGKYYWDLPFPADLNIGDMEDYLKRDDLVKNGCSTVTFDESLGYKIEDFVTFRRLDSQPELSKDWRFVRDIVGVDFNVAFKYRIEEETYLIDKTIANDKDVIRTDISEDIIKPKDWKGICIKLFNELSEQALIADPEFSEDSLQVDISQTNSNRFETSFNYKRTGIVKISSTTAYAGFNFG